MCFVRILCEAIVDDGGQEETEAVKAAEDGEIGRSREPDLYIEYTASDFRPCKWFVGRALLVQAVTSELFFDRREEASRLNGVRQEDGGADSDEDCE